MKEATGELNMTVITIVAIAAVGGLFYLFVWPMIQNSIVTQTCKTYGTDWKAYSIDEVNTGNNAKVEIWVCCPSSVTNNPGSSSNATNQGCVTTEYK